MKLLWSTLPAMLPRDCLRTMVHSLVWGVLECTDERGAGSSLLPSFPNGVHNLKLGEKQNTWVCYITSSLTVCLQNNNYDCPLPEEESNPRGSSWLYHSDAIRTYLNLMGKSKKDATLEACAGALQNLTASKGLVRMLSLPFLQSAPCISTSLSFPCLRLSDTLALSKLRAAGVRMLGLGLVTGAVMEADTPLPSESSCIMPTL